MFDKYIYKLLDLLDRFSNSRIAIVVIVVLLLIVSYTVTDWR
jgi:hypothetical protein